MEIKPITELGKLVHSLVHKHDEHNKTVDCGKRKKPHSLTTKDYKIKLIYKSYGVRITVNDEWVDLGAFVGDWRESLTYDYKVERRKNEIY